ncbi:hypothetical protein OSB04_031850 [Centaurea solstitialis]|uniref:CCHC-type domain-containing protein n=1 Tax=Centaurea solstitialis TaxID=347529 RepID=A0AA38VXZ8_9ASTR|nr:hypothetical protein OSB04_031850 [Centaurea solstitialis]
MSMKATLDLEMWTLADLFGSLKSQEPQLLQLKKSYGGPLALVAEGGSAKDREPKKEEKGEEEKEKGRKKKGYRGSESRTYRESGRREGSERREREEQKIPHRVDEQKKEEQKEGCFKCGKPGHFAAECWSKGPKILCGMAKIDPNVSNSNVPEKKQHMSTWVVDSGCSRHMTSTLGLLSSYLNQEGGSVVFGGNQRGKIKGYGMIVKGEVKMNQVSYVNGLKYNLISVSQLCDNGVDVLFKVKFCIMYTVDT